MVIEEGNIILRRLVLDDAERLASLANNKNIWNNVRDILPHPYTITHAIQFIEGCKGENPQLTFAIDFNNELVGVIGLVPQKDIYRLSVELGYWIGEPFWNKGIATKAVRLISDYAFTKLCLVRIFAGVFEQNRASQKVLEKAGFVLEGIHKKAIIKNNQLYDEYKYALVNASKQ